MLAIDHAKLRLRSQHLGRPPVTGTVRRLASLLVATSLLRACDSRYRAFNELWFDRQVDGLRSVWGSPDGQIWAVGTNIVVHFDGRTWDTTKVDNDLYDVHGCSSTDVWAVGKSSAKTLHFDGVSWKTVRPGTSSALNAVWCNRPDDVWVGGRHGYVFHFDGTSWTPFKLGHNGLDDVDVWDIWSGGGGRTWFASNLGVFVHDTDKWGEYAVPELSPRKLAGRPAAGDVEIWLVAGKSILRRSEFNVSAPWTAAHVASQRLGSLLINDRLGLHVASGRTTLLETAHGWEEHPEPHEGGRQIRGM